MLTIEQDPFITLYVTTFLATRAASGNPASIREALDAAHIAYYRMMEYGIGPKQCSTPESQR